MSYAGAFGQLLLYALLLGLGFWGLKSAVTHYLFARRRENINKLNARVSVLKMHLRGKIKRKCSRIEEVLKKDGGAFSNLQPKLSLICGLEFSSAGDYQQLLTNLNLITEEIIAHIHLKMKKNRHIDLEENVENVKDTESSESEKTADRCKKLIKYDKAHMIIVLEIIEATDELSSKISEFNSLAEFEKNQKIIHPPQKIQIENFDLLRKMVEETKKSDAETPDFPVLENGFFSESA